MYLRKTRSMTNTSPVKNNCYTYTTQSQFILAGTSEPQQHRSAAAPTAASPVPPPQSKHGNARLIWSAWQFQEEMQTQ